MEWIKVSERLPDHAKPILMFTKDDTWTMGTYYKCFRWNNSLPIKPTKFITHWMEIIPPNK